MIACWYLEIHEETTPKGRMWRFLGVMDYASEMQILIEQRMQVVQQKTNGSR